MQTKHFDITTFALVALALLWTPPGGAAKHPESYYQAQWCNARNGKIELAMPDGTRADCVTPTHAIEVDFGRKWAEAIGQSLSYALQTGKRPGIVLILEKPKHHKYWLRLHRVISGAHLRIDVWCIGAGCPQ